MSFPVRDRRDRRPSPQVPAVLHLQAALPRGGCLLPPALPGVRGFQPRKRDATTDLRGRRALLTGGRAKIGMYIALRLLRDGAHTTITTRFPNDAVRRFKAMEDSADWLHRLEIVGIDLRDPAQVVALADSVGAAGPLDILINNAAQTVRRRPAPTRPWSTPRRAAARALDLRRPRAGHLRPRTGYKHPLGPASTVARASGTGRRTRSTALALTAGSASLERIAAGTRSMPVAWCRTLPTSTAGPRW